MHRGFLSVSSSVLSVSLWLTFLNPLVMSAGGLTVPAVSVF